jgi:GTPase
MVGEGSMKGLVCRIAELAAEEGKAVVIVVNKWDTVDDKTAQAMITAEENIKAELRQVAWAKCIFISATQGMTYTPCL